MENSFFDFLTHKYRVFFSKWGTLKLFFTLEVKVIIDIISRDACNVQHILNMKSVSQV